MDFGGAVARSKLLRKFLSALIAEDRHLLVPYGAQLICTTIIAVGRFLNSGYAHPEESAANGSTVSRDVGCYASRHWV